MGSRIIPEPNLPQPTATPSPPTQGGPAPEPGAAPAAAPASHVYDPAKEQEPASWLGIARAFGTGVAQTAATAFGTPAAFLEWVAKAGQSADLTPEETMARINETPEQRKARSDAAVKQMPGSDLIQAADPKALIEAGGAVTNYDPKNRAERIAMTAGQVVPALAAGPQGIIVKALQMAGTVGGMEGASELLKGKTWTQLLSDMGIDAETAAKNGFDPREMDKNGPTPETTARGVVATGAPAVVTRVSRGVTGGFPGHVPDPIQARVDRAGEFGIDLTTGQATRSRTQMGKEEAARTAVKGEGPANVMADFDELQTAQVENARRNLLDTPSTGATQTERLQNVTGAVRGAEEASRGAIDAAYTGARGADASIANEGLARIPQDVREGLRQGNYPLQGDLTPHANEALRIIDEAAQGGDSVASRMSRGAQGPGADQRTWSLDTLENVRKQLVTLEERAKAKPEDLATVRAIKRQWDASIERSANDGLLRGDPQGLELWRNARALRRQHGETFETDFIKKLTDRDNPVSANEIGNAIIGIGKVGEKGESIRLAGQLRNILGEGSQQWQQVRESVLHQLTGGMEGDSPRTQAGKIREFASGRGDEYANAMFSQAERERMLRYADTLDDLTQPHGVRSHSGTTPTLLAAIGEKAGKAATAIGGTIGAAAGTLVAGKNPLLAPLVGGAIGMPLGATLGAVGKAYQHMSDTAAARRAVAGPVDNPHYPTDVVRGGVNALIDLNRKYTGGQF